MNVTLSIDEQLIARSRRVAAARGISLNQMIREELERITATVSGEDLVEELEAQWAREGGHSGGWTWKRGEIHDRPILR